MTDGIRGLRVESAIGPLRHPAVLALAMTALLVVAYSPPTGSSGGAGSAPPNTTVSKSVGPGEPVLGPNAPARLVPAVSSTEWINVTATGSGTAPPPEYAAASAYDPVAHATVLFGGCSNSQCPSNQTWTFANGVWTNVTPLTGSPPAREYASMDFDANMGGLLLFGGFGEFGELNDTWLYAGGVWTNLTYVGPAPSGRYGAAMAFDPQPEENGSVLFGGCDFFFFSIGCTNDTWIWQGWSGWSPVSTSFPPPAVGFASAAYDPWSQTVVLYGGCLGPYCTSYNQGTWELADGEWSEVGTTSSPGARSGASAVYDPVSQQILMFGGYNGGVYDNDTWAFYEGNWVNVTPAHSPPAREDAVTVVDPTGSTVLLFGGESSSGLLNDTWAFEVPPNVTASPSTTTTETSAAVSWSIDVSGGTAPYSIAVSFGDGTVESLLGTGPSFTAVHAFGSTGSFVAQVNLTDAVGGVAQATSIAIAVASGPVIFARAAPAATDVGFAIDFSAGVVSGGTGLLTYTWSFGDGTGTSGSSATHAYSAPGVFDANASGIDDLGASSNASATVVVVPDPTVAISGVRADPNATNVFVFHTGLGGGTGPFTYAWKFGDAATSSIPSPTHTYTSSGTFEVQLWVNDSVGATAYGQLSLAVTGSGSSSGANAGAFPLWFWGGIAALAAAAVAGTWFLRRGVGARR
jgi:PKD domain/Galactose oxidase, central domain/Kelch motif